MFRTTIAVAFLVTGIHIVQGTANGYQEYNGIWLLVLENIYTLPFLLPWWAHVVTALVMTPLVYFSTWPAYKSLKKKR